MSDENKKLNNYMFYLWKICWIGLTPALLMVVCFIKIKDNFNSYNIFII